MIICPVLQYPAPILRTSGRRGRADNIIGYVTIHFLRSTTKGDYMQDGPLEEKTKATRPTIHLDTLLSKVISQVNPRFKTPIAGAFDQPEPVDSGIATPVTVVSQ